MRVASAKKDPGQLGSSEEGERLRTCTVTGDLTHTRLCRAGGLGTRSPTSTAPAGGHSERTWGLGLRLALPPPFLAPKIPSGYFLCWRDDGNGSFRSSPLKPVQVLRKKLT